MIPKTKIQIEVARLSKKLTDISDKQTKWAYDHCIEHIGRISKKGISCLDCGHIWDEKPILLAKLESCKCPNCGHKLKVEETKKRVFKDSAYFGITTTHKGYQLFRLFFVSAKFFTNKSPEYSCHEVVQHWVSRNGKKVTLSVPRGGNLCYLDIWRWWERMEVRKYCHEVYNILPYKIYPAVKYLPEIKRNGFKGKYHGFHPADFFSLILGNNIAETLLKTGNIEWFKNFAHNQRQITRCWSAIKIAFRHKYEIKDRLLWLDYIDLLLYFHKDIRNPKVIFPDDLHNAHNKLVAKKREIQRKIDMEKKKKQAIQEEEAYKKNKGKYFGIAFSDDLINVRVLTSVQEFVEEGDNMHHCVYTNNYYKKNDSLILSATIGGKRIETIEISLNSFTIIQSRGPLNRNTEYHDRIIELVKKNMPLIRKKSTLKNSNHERSKQRTVSHVHL